MQKDRIELVRWGHQCPWAEGTEAKLQEMAEREGCGFCTSDIGDRPDSPRPALHFPFNTLLNGELVTSSPVFTTEIAVLSQTLQDTREVPQEDRLPSGQLDHVEPLGTANLADSLEVCLGERRPSPGKQRWYEENQTRYRGLVGFSGGRPKAILEYALAQDCPYAGIPPQDQALVILCLYSNDEAADYSGHLLDYFLDHCGKTGVPTVLVLSGRRAAYPNGPQDLFLSRRFRLREQVGQTRLLGRGVDEVVLMGWENGA